LGVLLLNRHFTRTGVSFLCIALLTLLPSCGSDEGRDIEVRESIREYLASRSNLAFSKMTLKVDSVEYEGDRATANVTISAREDEKASMQIVYQLRRTDSGWVVEPSAPGSAASPHGGGGTPGTQQALPPGHPPAGGTQPPAGNELPQGHPPVEGGSTTDTELPQDHPPVGK
jgi:hypothetical protein